MSNPRFADCSVFDLDGARKSGATIVDVREFPEFAACRLPGSRLIPLSQVADRSTEIARDRAVVVVCRTGRRSAEAAAVLCRLGFEDVRNLAGGIEACKSAGVELERDVRAPWSIERQVRIISGLLIIAGVLLSVFVTPMFVWLSAFVAAGMIHSAATDSCAMGLLLARMPWNARLNVTCDVERVPSAQ